MSFGLWLLMGKLRPRKAASFLGPSALQPPAAAKIYHHNASSFLPDSVWPPGLSPVGVERCGVGGAVRAEGPGTKGVPEGPRGTQRVLGWGRPPYALCSGVINKPPTALITFMIPRIPENRPHRRSN